MIILRQSTAIDIRMGPFLDVGDGFTPETGVTIAAADEAEVLKANGAATAAMAGTLAAVTGCDGWYDYTASATDTNTVGEVVFVMQDDSAYLPVFVRAYVVEEAIYDALFAGSAAAFDANQRMDVGAWLGTAVTTSSTTAKPQVDVDSIDDDATAANNLEADYDGTGYAKSNSIVGTVTTLTDHTAQTGDNYARLGAPAGESVSADVAAVKTTADAIETDTQAIETDTQDIQSRIPTSLTIGGKMDSSVNEVQTNAIGATGIATSAVSKIRQLASGTVDSGSTTTIVDTERTEAEDSFIGCWVLMTSGDAINQISRITAFNATTDTLTFSPALTQATSVGDTYEILPAGAVDAANSVWDALKAGYTVTNSMGEEQQSHALTSEVAEVETDTQDIQSRIPAALSSGRIVADVEAINDNTTAVDNLEASASSIVRTTIAAASTSTTINCDLTETTADHYIGRIIIFYSGALAGQASDITDYATGVLTVTELTEAPAENDLAVIV